MYQWIGLFSDELFCFSRQIPFSFSLGKTVIFTFILVMILKCLALEYKAFPSQEVKGSQTWRIGKDPKIQRSGLWLERANWQVGHSAGKDRWGSCRQRRKRLGWRSGLWAVVGPHSLQSATTSPGKMSQSLWNQSFSAPRVAKCQGCTWIW